MIKPSYDEAARAYIQALQVGNKPTRPDVGEYWEYIIDRLEQAYDRFGNINPKLEAMCRAYPELMDLLTITPCKGDDDPFPRLPFEVRLDTLDPACPWLDEYIAFSKKWSPRSYEKYHEPIGIALLSTVAARRVAFPFGGMEYTPLTILLVGETTFFRKTTAANLFGGLLYACGLDWLLGSDITTPQKLLSDMAGYIVPKKYGSMDVEQQERVRKRLAFSGQRGWYYEEFGMHLEQMVRDGGVMADFKGLLRVLDDGKPTYSTSTITRGTEEIQKPYLSLLGSLTPSDIEPHTGKNSKFWRDGLLARWAFVCVPLGEKGKRDRFPSGLRIYPDSLIEPIQQWHEWLGSPEIAIDEGHDKHGDPDGTFTIERLKDLPERVLSADKEVEDALYAYEDALLSMIEDGKVPKALAGNYGRLHKIALRVAMLLASFEARDGEHGDGHIEMRHLARGQAFAESRRRDLHELYAQVNTGGNETQKATIESEIERHLHKHGPMTLNMLRTSYMKKFSTEEIASALKFMKKRKAVDEFVTSTGWIKYRLIEEGEEDE